MKVLISGASGLVGTELAKQLSARGDQPIRLVRRPAASPHEIQWDPATGFIADGALDGVDALVNLAGATTGKLPWSKAYKQELIESRLASTRTLVNAINATGYGLTLGIHSRIDDTIEVVIDRLPVGNVYVNRNMIGAVVGVQPFGGEGLSGTGPKAGGPHYLLRFVAEQTLTVNTAAAGGNAELLAGL